MKISRSLFLRTPILIVLMGLLAAQSGPQLPLGTWRRASDAPVLSSRGKGWESAGTFNPAVIRHADKIVMLYRAQDQQGTSLARLRRQHRRNPFHPAG